MSGNCWYSAFRHRRLLARSVYVASSGERVSRTCSPFVFLDAFSPDVCPQSSLSHA